ncbi:protein kinase domain-containing protein [Rubinisphaera italica]|uniref:Serine/threonine-protein kinase Pkn1 n=1 Tax=Rubinisphaera italica TaxID=2527969 RepID=A0A5C5XEW8_9PLAN|nr:protein kinase [Rubinisphaera italica]TWT60442.1 Serine/threonine-protein kinase Pkn1 [Rubinisphaera italica]
MRVNPHILSRFNQEKQTLAQLVNPEIAQVFDAGTTPSGDPFFIMELCNGLPITQYCNVRRLPISDRLKLVTRICHALHHAHGKGIIHRDLKPDNILVADGDMQPVIKIIDFGIAKILDEETADSLIKTCDGEVIGTPAYMSPEQALAQPIDSRTDVFAIGATLYQLITDTTPVDYKHYKPSSLIVALKLAASLEPERPRLRIRKFSRDQQLQIANQLKLSPSQLLHLPADLDWIILRSIQPDRRERYANAYDFADDLERYLEMKPVKAVAPALSYRLKKFVRRNSTAVIASTLVCLTILLAGGTIGYMKLQEIQVESARISRIAEAVDTLHIKANSHMEDAGQDRKNIHDHLLSAQSDLEQAQDLLIETPELTELIALNNQALKRNGQSQRAMQLVNEIDRARNQPISMETENINSGMSISTHTINQFKDLFAEFGIHPDKTSPAKAAEILSNAPLCLHPDIVEALECWMNESPVGPGIYLQLNPAQCTVANFIPLGNAESSGLLSKGDELVEILAEDGSWQSFRGLSPTEAYRLINRPPGSIIQLKVRPLNQAEQMISLTCGGEISKWLGDTLQNFNPHPWAQQLREAVRNYDLQTLIKLANDSNLSTQRASSLILLSGSLFSLDQRDHAIRCLKIAQRSNPHEFWVNHYLGIALNCCHPNQASQEAIRYLTTAVALRPDSAIPRYNLGYILEKTGELLTALEFYQIALEIDPSHQLSLQRIHNLQGRINTETKSVDETDTDSQRDSNLQIPIQAEFDIPPYEQTARELASRGEFNRAMEILNDIRTHTPHDPRIDRTEGVVLLAQGKYAEAQQLLRETANCYPADAATRFYLGMSCHYLGLIPEAIQEYQAALQIRPDYEAVKTYLDPLLQ